MRWSSSISAPLVVLADRLPELGEERLRRDQVGLVPALGREPRRLALEHEPHLGEPRDVADVDAGDEDPAPRKDLDELLAGEVAERLADRRPPHAEPLHQLALADDRARRELERDDQLADRVVRAVRDSDCSSGARGWLMWSVGVVIVAAAGRGRAPRPCRVGLVT